MKKLILALATVFAVAGVASVEATCGCKREPKPCPTKQCEEVVRPCPKRCERPSRCKKCAPSKCGCLANRVMGAADNAPEAAVIEDQEIVFANEDEILSEDLDASSYRRGKSTKGAHTRNARKSTGHTSAHSKKVSRARMK